MTTIKLSIHPSEEGEGEPAPLKANQIPEVVLFRAVTKRYPPRANFNDVVSSVQKAKARLGRDVSADDLLAFYKAWCHKGYRENSLDWLEWAETGQIPVNGTWKSQRQTSKPDLNQIMREYAEENGYGKQF